MDHVFLQLGAHALAAWDAKNHFRATAMDIAPPQSHSVKANGKLLTCEPTTVLPMAQRYFLF